ncbi:MAG TPA: hypothetical protein PK186_05930 [candidate division Zixibacteria bacterium]|nr:hypothetical protein [candidate division Zixibacteria bacterium]MDD4918577.1 hypothetical protein [candidate division Zixibacteria bacterium]MDM7971970.1 hypothetical protein [candidate division Zixibacteria bacterium]HPM37080.1 hypothetical protein [candidate division Zixibacteria bacterium]
MFRLLQQLLVDDFGEQDLAPYMGVIWDDLDGSKSTSVYNRFEYDGVPGFYIASRANFLDNWDEWDGHVIAHEFAHHLMFSYMERIPGGGDPYDYLFPLYGSENARAALTEGRAFYAGCSYLGEVEFVNSTFTDPACDVKNLEYPLPDPPYYDDNQNLEPLPPPPLNPQYDGAQVPGAVAVSLIDLDDNADDGNQYIGGALWGHNQDYNGGSWWAGPAAIWHVLTNYDPARQTQTMITAGPFESSERAGSTWAIPSALSLRTCLPLTQLTQYSYRPATSMATAR